MIETKDAETPRTGKSANRRIPGRALVIVIAVLATPVLLFFAASALVNRARIPAEMEQFPPELAALLAPATTGGTPGDATDEFVFPVARLDDVPTTTTKGQYALYDTFLEAELRERPELEGVQIYLELRRRFGSGDRGKGMEFSTIDHGEIAGAWKAGSPLPSRSAEWLIAHAEIVGQLLRMAESSGLPVRTRETAPDQAKTLGMPIPDDVMLWNAEKVLAAEGQRLLEAGDAAGAERHWRAAIRLSANLERAGAARLRSSGSLTLSMVVLPLTGWVAANNVPWETLTGLRTTLAEVHRRMFPPNLASEFMLQAYSVGRSFLVAELDNAPWHSRTFGWDAREYPWVENPNYSFYAFGQQLPRLDRLAPAALRAMRSKSAAPRIMSEVDRIKGEAIRREAMTWPALVAAGPVLTSERERLPEVVKVLHSVLVRVSGNDDHYFTIGLLRSEARLDLLRAAIEWRLAPPDAKPDPAAMTITDRESPWRDPFAEAPFHATVLPSGGGVLLYSLGPDLQDQQGQIEYDPTNGTVSAGDLTLEVKR